MKTGIELIAEERQRQIEVEGFTFNHDETYESEHLAFAAVCYALPDRYRVKYYLSGEEMPTLWPFMPKWWKPCPDDRIRELQKAGALIAAEIDRLQNLKNK